MPKKTHYGESTGKTCCGLKTLDVNYTREFKLVDCGNCLDILLTKTVKSNNYKQFKQFNPELCEESQKLHWEIMTEHPPLARMKKIWKRLSVIDPKWATR